MALPLLHKLFSLFDEEGIWDASISRAQNDAYEIVIASGDVARAVIEGDDSPATAKMKRQAEECAKQTPQGMSKDVWELVMDAEWRLGEVGPSIVVDHDNQYYEAYDWALARSKKCR